MVVYAEGDQGDSPAASSDVSEPPPSNSDSSSSGDPPSTTDSDPGTQTSSPANDAGSDPAPSTQSGAAESGSDGSDPANSNDSNTTSGIDTTPNSDSSDNQSNSPTNPDSPSFVDPSINNVPNSDPSNNSDISDLSNDAQTDPALDNLDPSDTSSSINEPATADPLSADPEAEDDSLLEKDTLLDEDSLLDEEEDPLNPLSKKMKKNLEVNPEEDPLADQQLLLKAKTSPLLLGSQPTYTVSFDVQGHGSAPTSQSITSGEKVQEPTAPTADGFTFGGWFKESGCNNAWFFDSDTVTGELTLFAKWISTDPTVTFDVQGHGTAPASQTVSSGSTISEPAAPTAEGYSFGGWYKEAACNNAWNFASDTVTSDIILYAKWDGGTDAWIEDYIDTTGYSLNEGATTDCHGRPIPTGLSGTVTLGHFKRQTYPGPLEVYGITQINGKYYQVNLMNSSQGAASTDVGNPMQSSWHDKAKNVTSLRFIEGSADGQFTSGKVIANDGCQGMFRHMNSVTFFDLSGLDMTETTNIGHLFCQNWALESINVNTAIPKATNIYHLFGACTAVKFINLSKADFSNATVVGTALNNCTGLETILTPKIGANSVALPAGIKYFTSYADYAADPQVNYHMALTSILQPGTRLMKTPTPQEEGEFPTQISIDTYANPPAIFLGQSSQVTAKVTWDDGSITDESSSDTIIWASSDPSIATVDSNGKAIGVNYGCVWITATSVKDNSVIGRAFLEVIDPPKLYVQRRNIPNTVDDNPFTVTQNGAIPVDGGAASVADLRGNRYLFINNVTDAKKDAWIARLSSESSDPFDPYALTVYDASIYMDAAASTPAGNSDFTNCTIRVALPASVDLTEDVHLYSVENGALETFRKYSESGSAKGYRTFSSVDGTPMIEFTTDHFSDFAICYSNRHFSIDPSVEGSLIDTANTDIDSKLGLRGLYVDNVTDSQTDCWTSRLNNINYSYDNLCVFDINLWKLDSNYNKIEKVENGAGDFGTCTITMLLPSYMDINNGRIQLFSLVSGYLETFESYADNTTTSGYKTFTDTDGRQKIKFRTNHFSPYVLVYTANVTPTPPTVITKIVTQEVPVIKEVPVIVEKSVSSGGSSGTTVIQAPQPAYTTVRVATPTPNPSNYITPANTLTSSPPQAGSKAPVTGDFGDYSGAPPGRPPDTELFGISLLLLLIVMILYIRSSITEQSELYEIDVIPKQNKQDSTFELHITDNKPRIIRNNGPPVIESEELHKKS